LNSVPSPHHCGLDGDRRAEGDRRGIACDRSAAEDGSQATLLFREDDGAAGRGRKSLGAIAA
jgi:hypothetical protein